MNGVKHIFESNLLEFKERILPHNQSYDRSRVLIQDSSNKQDTNNNGLVV